MHAQLYATTLGLTVDTHANTYSLFTHADTNFDMLTLRYSCALSKIAADEVKEFMLISSDVFFSKPT